MFKYGGQVERISHKSLYYTVLQQKQRNVLAVMIYCFCFHLFILFVCDSKTKKKEKYTYTKILYKIIMFYMYYSQKHEHMINSSGVFFLGVTSTWVIVSLRTNRSNVL